MLVKLLSNIIIPIFSAYRYFVTPRDYSIISEEIEYRIDYRMKYQIEDDFWKKESKNWDGILDGFHTYVTGEMFRGTIVPQNVKDLTVRIKYWYGGKVYKSISNDINFKPSEPEKTGILFSIPLSDVWIVDHDDKPRINITEKVRRYAGPRNDFHGQSVELKDFLYYSKKTLEKKFPKIILTNALGMKKILLTLEDFTTDLRIP